MADVTGADSGTDTSQDKDKAPIHSPVGPLRHHCPQCPTNTWTSKLLRCTGCLAVRYCSRAHQAAHRPQHKFICKKIRKARTRLAEEEALVRNATPDAWTPANAFETHVGLFWGIVSTRDYMRARFTLAWGCLASTDSLDGAQEGLDHMRDMLRLCRSDNLGVRDVVPATMLRLDLDQESYDFVKWWASCDPAGDYDWDDQSLPYLDIREADVFEEPDFLVDERNGLVSLNHIIAVLLLKLKLLVDIRNLKMTRKILLSRTPLLPPELRDQIELAVVRSPLSIKLQREETQSLDKLERKLVEHARDLGLTMMSRNEQFIFDLFSPEDALLAEPSEYSHGSEEESALAIQNSYAAWCETEGVLDLLDDARECAARDIEGDIPEIMGEEASGITPESALAHLSIIELWNTLGDAVEDALYLGPWSERPSERYARANKEVLSGALEQAEED